MADPYQNIFATVLGRVHSVLAALTAAGALPTLDASRVAVEPPRDATHGDMATNVAMVLAKEAGKKPRELAELVAEKLRADDLIAKVDVAGPGFINLALKPEAWINTLRAAIANLLDFAGLDVTREYYINDAGAQVDVLARSAFLRYREALGETITIPEGLYPGDYLVPIGAALVAEFGASLTDKAEAEWLPQVRARALDLMMAMIR